MKYILQQLLGVLLLLNSCTTIGQDKDYELETMYMNCICKSLSDNGVELITILKKAEKILIEKKLLKDGGSESYIALYKDIEKATDGKLQNLGVAEYSMKMMEGFDIDVYVDCIQEFMQNNKFLESKMDKILSLSLSENDRPEIRTLANSLLDIFDAEDFKHDFYKYFTFSMLDKYNQKGFEVQNVDRSLPEETIPETIPEHAFKIELRPEGQLSVNGKQIALKDLRKEIIAYLKEKKSENIIMIRYDRMIEYRFFISVQNEITNGLNTVRDEVAKEKFKRLFDDLTADEQEEIKQIYPMKISEIEIK